MPRLWSGHLAGQRRFARDVMSAKPLITRRQLQSNEELRGRKNRINLMNKKIQSKLKAVNGVGEWAKKSVNIQSGCEHDCRYCYAKGMACRFHQASPASWAHPTKREGAVREKYRKMGGRIMFPTSHDITPENIGDCLEVLLKLLQAGNEVLIVSKPHLECVKVLCAEQKKYKKQMLFRFTIGSADDEVLRFWEPGAPAFAERLAALKWAHGEGYASSVSCEPMLDLHIDKVIEAAKSYVTDAIWLGRVNRLRQTIAINCPGDMAVKARVEQLLAEQTDEHMRELHARYENDPQIKFKDSIKQVVGLARPTEKGMDV